MKSLIFMVFLVAGIVFFSVTAIGVNCYDLGYKFGLCSTLSMHGYACPAGTDVVIPPECRNLSETKRGIMAGVRAAYRRLGLDENGNPL